MADEQPASQPTLIRDSLLPSAKEGNTYTPLAAMSNEEVLAQAGAMGMDPLASKLRQNEQMVASGSLNMSGIADPKFASNSLQMGDKVYSPEFKAEAIIKDISAAGKAQIRFTTGKRKGTGGWVSVKNIAKIPS